MPLHPDQPHLTASEAAKIREDYEELIRTPGWRRFVEYVTERYTGIGYANGMNQALTSGDPLKPHIFNGIAREVNILVGYPLMMVRDLKGTAE